MLIGFAGGIILGSITGLLVGSVLVLDQDQTIVRCKDCRWFIPDEVIHDEGMCDNLKAWVIATCRDFGCICAERKGEDE